MPTAALCDYLEQLTREYGYGITIKDFSGFLVKDPQAFRSLSRYLLHPLPFCHGIKREGRLFDACLANTRRLEQRCRREREPFVGSCYCGVYERIYPVYEGDVLLAALCLSGFAGDRDRSFEKLHGVVPAAQWPAWEKALCDSTSCFVPEDDWHAADVRCGMVAAHLRLIYRRLAAEGRVDGTDARDCAAGMWVLSLMLADMEAHYTEPLTLPQVAGRLGYSVSYVSHTFDRLMGISFKRYLNILRVAQAKERLRRQPTAAVAEIAGQCGFTDPNYFCTVFKQMTGLTPTQFRRRT